MHKTDVAGLVKDGKGTVVNKDLAKYHDIKARRNALLAQNDTRQEIEALRNEVRELREMVLALLEGRQ